MQVNSDQSLERAGAIHRHFGSWNAVRKAVRENGWSWVLDNAGVPEPEPDERQTYTGRVSVVMRQPENP
ncbi:hypothetical protein [Croceibacterium ferulae]|uniref:hypothetical protein n=1 Tax=Croceibacterium ferulae TaxID=1854641 RepID=UPI000EB05DF7|nr:hypothetical protein [Croceibacterium ferulae]